MFAVANSRNIQPVSGLHLCVEFGITEATDRAGCRTKLRLSVPSDAGQCWIVLRCLLPHLLFGALAQAPHKGFDQ
ncbi:hypothetical protein CXX93_19470 (plasmid) [Gordonia sp. YC-JH1]|nr:hypothetical protein CXX93_19470 [Gordonia sp. YC-JH1]